MRSLPWTLPDREGHLYVDAIAAALVQVRQYLFPGYPTSALMPYAQVAWLLSSRPAPAEPACPGAEIR
jgi:hypothetical protein